MGVKLFVVLALAGPLVACAVSPDASPEQIARDAKAAGEAQCRKMKTVVQGIDCLDAINRPIWQREAPDTLDLYLRWFIKARMFAAQYDNGKLSSQDAIAAQTGARAELLVQVRERQQYRADQAVAAQAQAQDISSLFLMMLGAGLSGYNQGAGYNHPPAAIVTTSCTTLGAVTNCVSQ